MFSGGWPGKLSAKLRVTGKLRAIGKLSRLQGKGAARVEGVSGVRTAHLQAHALTTECELALTTATNSSTRAIAAVLKAERDL